MTPHQWALEILSRHGAAPGEASVTETAAVVIGEAVREAVADAIDRLAKRWERLADLYQMADGEPGPLSSEWGWRASARRYRDEAKAVRDTLK